jgi:hypothetical protein
MTVELLYTEGCPHVAAYLPHLQQLVAGAGLNEPVRTHVVADNDQAQRERFLGSPTVRIAGVDVDPSAEGRLGYGLACRLYPTPGGPQCHPADDWVLSRLRQHLGQCALSLRNRRESTLIP